LISASQQLRRVIEVFTTSFQTALIPHLHAPVFSVLFCHCSHDLGIDLTAHPLSALVMIAEATQPAGKKKLEKPSEHGRQGARKARLGGGGRRRHRCRHRRESVVASVIASAGSVMVSAASVAVSATPCGGCVMDRVAGEIAMTISALGDGHCSGARVSLHGAGAGDGQAVGMVRLRAPLPPPPACRENSRFPIPLGGRHGARLRAVIAREVWR